MADSPRYLVTTLCVLTAVTGIVDAVSFLALGHVFTANMTGNVAFVGFALAGATGVSLPRSVTALGAFSCGSLVAGHFLNRNGPPPVRHLSVALWTECVLLSFAAASAYVLVGNSVLDEYVLIVTTAVTMGFRNAYVRSLAIPDLTTTVLTMTVTGLAADSRLASGNAPRAGRRRMSIVSMSIGALMGTAVLRLAGPASALLAAAVIVACLGAWISTITRTESLPSSPGLHGSAVDSGTPTSLESPETR